MQVGIFRERRSRLNDLGIVSILIKRVRPVYGRPRRDHEVTRVMLKSAIAEPSLLSGLLNPLRL